MASEDNVYTYESEPISPEDRETRLLELHPGNWDSKIVISLTKFKLEDKNDIEFEALRYCWGHHEKIDEVHVGQEKVIPITKNLSVALRHLRPREGEKRKLWIDALCINQKDEAEKTKHVKWMGHIYQQAPKVIVFLGELVPRDAAAMDLLVRYGEAIEISEGEKPYTIKKGSDKKLFVKGALNLSQDQTDGINDLMSRPWFDRVWIIQEVALMKDAEKSIIQCGHKWVCWESFRRGYWLVASHPPKEVVRPGSKLAKLKLVPESSYAISDPSWKIRTVDLFWGIHEYQCSVPLDIFYGVLGLLNAHNTKDGEGKYNKIKVNYNQSLKNLFKMIQKQEIKTEGLDLLRFCEMEEHHRGKKQHAKKIKKYSWVPVPLKVPSFLANTRANPMGRFKSNCQFDKGGNLKVYGQSIGSVSNTFDCTDLANHWFKGADLAFVLNEFYYLCSIKFFGEGDQNTTLMAIMDVLSQHLYEESSPGYDNPSRENMNEYVSEFCGRKGRDPLTIPAMEGSPYCETANKVEENLDAIFRKPPVLYVTDTGHIGLGTGATAKKDQVCGIYGLGTYMILRSDGGKGYGVVGPTCVGSQKLAEAILGPLEGSDDTWVVFDPEKERNVLQRGGIPVPDGRLTELTESGDSLYFSHGEFDIDGEESDINGEESDIDDEEFDIDGEESDINGEESDIDESQLTLAKKLKHYRQSFLLI